MTTALGGVVVLSCEERSVEKHLLFARLLENGMTMLHLDAREKGVCVPKEHARDQDLRLNFSYRFQLETFEIDQEKVVASLSFQGHPFLCVVPWASVFAMTSHVTDEFQVWQEDLPEEMLDEIVQSMREHQAADSFEECSDDDLKVGGAVRRVGHLRVIK
jgi:stringent starvation protein B